MFDGIVKVYVALCVLAVFSNYVKCTCQSIISRKEWNASEPKEVVPLKVNPPPFVVVHHSATPPCFTTEICKSSVKSFQTYHMQTLGWEDIGYNFLIGGDGNIYEGRGWGVHGAHVPKFNAKSIGVCLIGNFQREQPEEIALEALKNLISCGLEKDKITTDYHLIGHRQGSATLCPGDKLFEEIKKWPHFQDNPS